MNVFERAKALATGHEEPLNTETLRMMRTVLVVELMKLHGQMSAYGLFSVNELSNEKITLWAGEGKRVAWFKNALINGSPRVWAKVNQKVAPSPWNPVGWPLDDGEHDPGGYTDGEAGPAIYSSSVKGMEDFFERLAEKLVFWVTPVAAAPREVGVATGDHEEFHCLWNAMVGTPGYIKTVWLALEQRMNSNTPWGVMEAARQLAGVKEPPA